MSIKSSLRDRVYATTSRYAPWLHSAIVSRRRPDARVDPRIRYPSYKSLDGLIDVERLKGLDAVVRRGVERYLRERDAAMFDTGQLKLDPTAARHPGSRMIELSVSKRPASYHELNACELWEPGPAADHFPELMAFIATLPFEATGRMVILCDLEGRPVTAHRDHFAPEILHEFIWFRTNFDKPFFVQSWQTKERRYIESYSAWFE